MFATSAFGWVFVLLAAAPLTPDAPRQRTVLPGDQTILQNAGLPVEGPTLLKLLERRADPDGALKLVDSTITRLSDSDKGTFGPAQVEVLGLGAIAVPALQRLANRVENPEVAARARACIASLEGPAGGNVTLAVIRALAALRPENVEAVLFAYLPFAESEGIFRETQQVLANLCPVQGEIPETYLKALKDADSIRRQVAAEVLCGVHGVAAHAVVRPLLTDPRAGVRQRVALALTESYDPAAVPVLIDLLSSAAPGERRRIEESLTRLAGDWAFTAPPGADNVAGDLRRALWKSWWETLSEERLLGLFRTLIHSEEEYLRWQETLAKLNAAEAEVREKAIGELVAIGPKVLPLVRRVVQLGSPRERTLAAQAVTALERSGTSLRLPECAPRLLALRRPAATVQVLLDALPWIENPLVEQQVRDVLPIVAVENGKPAPILLDRLRSKLPTLRSAAAATLAHVGGAADLVRVRELVADPDPVVRMHAGIGLAQRGDRTALPAVIDLLATLPLDRAGEVEDFLVELAGDNVPSAYLGTTAEERGKCKQAWSAWWQANGNKVVLEDAQKTRVRARTLLLIESYDPTRRNGRIIELDRTGRVLLDLAGLSYPMHAERVGSDRLLIAEQGTSRVSERDLQGRVLKEWSVGSAFYCQRFRNGNTYLGGRNQLQEIDRDGKVVWTYQSPADTILATARLRDGQTAVLTYQGRLTRLDAAGKPTQTLNIPIQNLGGVNGAEILPGDRILCATAAQNRVVEFDETGKIVWEASVPGPQSVSRLPGGTTLVATTGGARLLEIDRTGRIVQEWKDLPVKPLRGLMR